MDLLSFTWTLVPSLAILVIIGQILAVLLLGMIAYEKLSDRQTMLTRKIGEYALLLMLIVSLTAVGGSLFFSEISGWVPCKYCWIQRIFMYPQPILLGIALWKKDRNVARYILALCIIGGLYSAYHFYIQMYDIIASPTNPATPCDASGESCVKTPFAEFGYITIPMMALTGFVLNAIGSYLSLRSKNQKA